MTVVYCGFFEKLGEILMGIFVTIFSPIIEALSKELFGMVINILKDAFSALFMSLLISLLKMVDFFCDIFDIFSGVRYVHYTPPNGGWYPLQVPEGTKLAGQMVQYKQVYLLDLFMQSSSVVKAFWVITFIAMVLAFMFTIYSVAKSVSDMALDDKNPIGKVLGRGLRAAGNFFIVPLMVMVILQLSTIVVSEVNDVLMRSYSNSNAGKPPSVGTLIFLTGSMGADKANIPSDNASFTDAVRGAYYLGTKQYSNYDQVEKDFDFTRFSTGTGIILAIFVMFIMVGSLLLFVRRIIEILLLYIVSPLFVSTIPLDDGQLFAKWRDIFIAKVFSGFGVVFTMKLYLMLVPLISGSSLRMSNDPSLDSMLKMFVIIGGAWTTYRSQHLFLQILSPEAASAAQMSTGRMVGAAMGTMAATRGLASSAIHGGGGGGGAARRSGGGGNAMSSHQEQFGAAAPKSQAFTGK